MTPAPFDAVLLAGGGGRRLGGVDKPGLRVAGGTLLELGLAAVAGAGRVVVVGPRRNLPERVVQVHEDPPGSGPCAALATALPHVTASTVVVLAADLPRVSPVVVDALREAATGRDGAVLVDDDDHDQVLTSVWATAALQTALAAGDLTDRPLRPLLAGLDVARLPARAIGLGGWADCDTPEDLRRARMQA